MEPNKAYKKTVDENVGAVYFFPKGLPGFETLKKFALREHNELFSLLTAVDEPEAIFIAVNPFDFFPEYEFVLPDDTIKDIGIKNREQVTVRCIVTWHSDRAKTTVNLLAPLIFNMEEHKGKQIVLQNTTYTTKHPLWTAAVKGDEGGDS